MRDPTACILHDQHDAIVARWLATDLAACGVRTGADLGLIVPTDAVRPMLVSSMATASSLVIVVSRWSVVAS